MPVFFANLWQVKNISIMCGMNNSSVAPRIMMVMQIQSSRGVPELLVSNISTSSKNILHEV